MDFNYLNVPCGKLNICTSHMWELVNGYWIFGMIFLSYPPLFMQSSRYSPYFINSLSYFLFSLSPFHHRPMKIPSPPPPPPQCSPPNPQSPECETRELREESERIREYWSFWYIKYLFRRSVKTKPGNHIVTSNDVGWY